jgi:Fe2+ transport system protein FeoA
VTLADLALDEPALILSVGGERTLRRRLMELGLLPKTQVRVMHIAPMGDPMSLRVRDTTLSIRKAEAQQIEVTLLTMV